MLTVTLGGVFEKPPEVFESQVGPNSNHQKQMVTPDKLCSSSWGELLLNLETQSPMAFLSRNRALDSEFHFEISVEESDFLNFNIKKVKCEFRVLSVLVKRYDCDTLDELRSVGASTRSLFFVRS